MTDPASALERLWLEGRGPDLADFLAGRTKATDAEVAEAIRVDQRWRWQAGERVPAEDYLRRFPALQANRELALDVIFNEYLLRADLNEDPDDAEFLRRFPEYASVLKDQFALHEAIVTRQLAAGPTQLGKTPVDPGPADLPSSFGRYRIIRRLGQGGMGTVFLAEDTKMRRQVALKVPRLDDADRGILLERFEREARIAGSLRHPHLCPVHDVGEIDGIHFLTMPLLDGEPLSALIKRQGALTIADAVRIAIQTARAMHVAHQAGIVHRDLKPSNIMIDRDGAPIVMDFGLARAHGGGDPRLTSSGALLGTGAYAAPEQVGASHADTGPACDVYSLGVVLYEMLTGRVPFGGNLREVLRGVLSEPPPAPRQFRPEIAQALEAICLKALAKDPAKRFASMEAMAQALETTEHRRAGAEHDTESERSLPAIAKPRRSRRLVLVVPFAAIALGVAFWLIVRQKDEPAPVDPLPGGSVWVGEFDFAGMQYAGDITVRITERDGDRFRGVYQTEHGDYQWQIEGQTRGNAVEWRFTGVIAEREARQVVGNARVDGTINGNDMTAVFFHPTYNSTANLKLRRKVE